MSRKIGHLIVMLALTAVVAHAQRAANTPTEHDMYCSGMITTDRVPADTYVISGVESDQRIIYSQNNLVFINKGAKQGVKVGDQFLVSRPESDQQMQTQWVSWQAAITKAMGTTYADLWRRRVAAVQENTSTAEVVQSCDYIERGDIVLPFTPRPAPQFKPKANFDMFAPPSGKAKAMVAATLGFGVTSGAGTIVYVNLGRWKQGRTDRKLFPRVPLPGQPPRQGLRNPQSRLHDVRVRLRAQAIRLVRPSPRRFGRGDRRARRPECRDGFAHRQPAGYLHWGLRRAGVTAPVG